MFLEIVDLLDEGNALAEQVDAFARRYSTLQATIDRVAANTGADDYELGNMMRAVEQSSGFVGVADVVGYMTMRLVDAFGGYPTSAPATLGEARDAVESARRTAERARPRG